MINFLKKIRNSLKKTFQKDRSRIGISSSHDWAVMLVIFFILVIIIALIHTYMLTKINSDELFKSSGDTDGGKEHFDQAELERVILEYTGKEEKFLELHDKKPSLVDPSL